MHPKLSQTNDPTNDTMNIFCNNVIIFVSDVTSALLGALWWESTSHRWFLVTTIILLLHLCNCLLLFFPIPLFLAVSFFLLPFFQFSVTFFPVTFFPVSFCPVTFIPVSFFPIFIVTFFPVTFFPVTFFPVSFFTFLFFLLLCFLLRELESNWSGCNVLNFSWNFCFIPQILVVARMSIYEHVTWFTALVLLKLGL